MELSKVCRYEQLEFCQWIALGTKIGGLKTVIAALRGKLDIDVRPRGVELSFDDRGTLVSTGCAVRKIDNNCRFEQPELSTVKHFGDRLDHLHRMLSVDTGITNKHFKEEIERLKQLIDTNDEMKGLLNGAWPPVILPKLTRKSVGAEFDRYLDALERSFRKIYDRGELRTNCGRGSFRDSLWHLPGIRHTELIGRMWQNPVIGIYFPQSLQGYSVRCSRELAKILPQGYLLSGLDSVIAMIMYTKIMARSKNVPFLNLSAFCRRPEWKELYLVMGLGEGLAIDIRNSGNLDQGSSNCSSSLLFVGE